MTDIQINANQNIVTRLANPTPSQAAADIKAAIVSRDQCLMHPETTPEEAAVLVKVFGKSIARLERIIARDAAQKTQFARDRRAFEAQRAVVDAERAALMRDEL